MGASVLTNSAAMVALQTLRSTNSSLQEVNSQISTGKKVATAKDNAAIFAISKVMESDVAGFEAVSESLALGQSTVAVASNAANSIGELLNEIKGKIVAANEDNVDRGKLQDEIASLRDQIASVVSSAQFNGLNLVDGSNSGSGGFSVLASLNRDGSGNVGTTNISFDPADTNLSTTNGTALVTSLGDASANAVVAGSSFGVSDQAGANAANAAEFDITTGDGTLRAANGGAVTDGLQFGNFDFQTAAATTGGATAIDGDDKTAPAGLTSGAGILAGDVFRITVDGVSASYTVNEGDSESDIVAGLRGGLLGNGLDTDRVSINVVNNLTAGEASLQVSNLTSQDIAVSFTGSRGSGGLAGLASLSVATATDAATALNNVEGFIQAAVDAQAELGTTEKRLEIQASFQSTLIDSFKAGIGSLVDADLEEASARLQSLQVQQQLGIQALSIANQAPQNILALFR